MLDLLTVATLLLFSLSCVAASAVRMRYANTFESCYLADRSLPFWSVAGGMVGSEFLMFGALLALPSAAMGDFSPIILGLGIVCGRCLTAVLILPAFRSSPLLSTAYELFQDTFDSSTRRVCSALYLSSRFGVATLGAIIAAEFVGELLSVSPVWLVTTMTVTAWAVSRLGGLAGAARCLNLIVALVLLGLAYAAADLLGTYPGGLTGLLGDLVAHPDHYRFGEWNWDFSQQDSLGAGLIGGMIWGLAIQGADQSLAQFLLAAKCRWNALAGLLLAAILSVLLITIGALIGLTVERIHDQIAIAPRQPIDQLQAVVHAENRLAPTIANLPFVLVRSLSRLGEIALVVAVLGLGTGCLVGTLLGTASTLSWDWRSRVSAQARDPLDDRQLLTKLGLILMALTVLGSSVRESLGVPRTLVETSAIPWIPLALMGFGLILGLFLLAAFVERAGARAAMVGVSCSALITLAYIVLSPVSLAWQALIAATSVVLVGFLASFLWPSPTPAEPPAASSQPNDSR